MPGKFALFAFNGDPMCFVHVLLNTLDMHRRGFDVALVIEGSATSLINEFEKGTEPISSLLKDVRDIGLLECACNACSIKMGSQESAQRQGIRLCGEMMGHPSMSRFIEEGYNIITF